MLNRETARERLCDKLTETRGRTFNSLFAEFEQMQIKGTVQRCRECLVALWLTKAAKLSPFFVRVLQDSAMLLHPEDRFEVPPAADDHFILPKILAKIVRMYDFGYLYEFEAQPSGIKYIGTPMAVRLERFKLNLEQVLG